MKLTSCPDCSNPHLIYFISYPFGGQSLSFLCMIEFCSAVRPTTIILISKILCHILSVVNLFYLSIRLKCCTTNYDLSYFVTYFIRTYYSLCFNIVWIQFNHILISFSNLSVTPLILSVSVSLTSSHRFSII